MTSVMRPDPRYELALATKVPHTQTEHPDTSAVAVTCSDISVLKFISVLVSISFSVNHFYFYIISVLPETIISVLSNFD